MAAFESFLGSSVERIGRGIRLLVGGSVGIKVGAITADVALSAKSPIVARFNPSTANRNIDLYQAGAAAGLIQLIQNAGSTYSLVVRVSGPSTVATLAPGDWGVFFSVDGTTYYAMTTSSVAGALATILATASTWTALQTFGAGAALKDSVSYFYDDGDATKKVAIQVSGVTTGTTRTLTVQDADGTLELVDAGVTSLKAADAAAGLPYVSAADTWAVLTLAADKGVYATGAGALAAYDLTAYGRSLGGVADEAAFKALVNLETGVDVQAYSATLALLAANARDAFVKATIAVPDVGSGGTDAAATLQLTDLGGTNISTPRQVLILASAAQYKPFSDPPAIASVSFSAATTGSIIASGAGYALVETDATGAFACTIGNTDDETIYFYASSGQVSDLSKACVVVGSNSDAAAWSA